MARPAAMTAHLTLTAETIRPLLAALDALGQEAEARRVALLHDSGLVLAETGVDAHHDQGESGALAAGAFFAAQLLAQRLGDHEFTGLHYQGATRDFLLSSAAPEALLLVVFDDRTRPAIVRACLLKHLPAIQSAATRVFTTPPPPMPDSRWPAAGPFCERPLCERPTTTVPDLASVFDT